MKNVLIIEDDINIVDLLEIHLKDLECNISRTHDGESGLQLAMAGKFDLIILDIMLPKMEGMEVCRQIRAQKNGTPILMLTAKSEEIDKVLGLETGADDYLTKPFSVREFIARVKAIFRRTKFMQESIVDINNPILKYDTLLVDIDKRKVTIEDKRVELSPKEFDLLTLLASNPGKSFTRQRILNLVWGYEFEGYEHTVNSHINRLRGKIEKNIAEPKYILTAWGVGYRFNEDI
ncbi:MAG: two-component system alkaline phosphatase synthesis response regulator PhoP [Saprospiraceae bacterium]|jgi:two-component system alkaline phosphatase synthesis response regulator PhoP